MPLLIDCRRDEPIELGDLVEMLATGNFDPDDEASIALRTRARQLGNNRPLPRDRVIEELKRSCAGQVERNMIYRRSSCSTMRPGFAIRAQFSGRPSTTASS